MPSLFVQISSSIKSQYGNLLKLLQVDDLDFGPRQANLYDLLNSPLVSAQKSASGVPLTSPGGCDEHWLKRADALAAVGQVPKFQNDNPSLTRLIQELALLATTLLREGLRAEYDLMVLDELSGQGDTAPTGGSSNSNESKERRLHWDDDDQVDPPRPQPHQWLGGKKWLMAGGVLLAVIAFYASRTSIPKVFEGTEKGGSGQATRPGDGSTPPPPTPEETVSWGPTLTGPGFRMPVAAGWSVPSDSPDTQSIYRREKGSYYIKIEVNSNVHSDLTTYPIRQEQIWKAQPEREYERVQMGWSEFKDVKQHTVKTYDWVFWRKHDGKRLQTGISYFNWGGRSFALLIRAPQFDSDVQEVKELSQMVSRFELLENGVAPPTTTGEAARVSEEMVGVWRSNDGPSCEVTLGPNGQLTIQTMNLLLEGTWAASNGSALDIQLLKGTFLAPFVGSQFQLMNRNLRELESKGFRVSYKDRVLHVLMPRLNLEGPPDTGGVATVELDARLDLVSD